MKLGWIAKRDREDETYEFFTEQPPSWYVDIIQIVYAVIEE